MKPRHRDVAVTALALATAAVGCGGSAPEATSDPAEEARIVPITPELVDFGRETYALNCAPCHGPNGRGDGPSAAHLDPSPRDHTDPSLMDAISDKRIADTIKMGGIMFGFPNMPSNPALSIEQIEALVAYVRRMSSPGATEVDLTGFVR